MVVRGVRARSLILLESQRSNANSNTHTGTIPEKYIKRGNGFYRVAWGFLRTIDKQGEPIVGHKTRDLKLALYKYPNKGKVSSFVKMQAQSGRANIGDLAFVPDVFLLYAHFSLFVTLLVERRVTKNKHTHK